MKALVFASRLAAAIDYVTLPPQATCKLDAVAIETHPESFKAIVNIEKPRCMISDAWSLRIHHHVHKSSQRMTTKCSSLYRCELAGLTPKTQYEGFLVYELTLPDVTVRNLLRRRSAGAAPISLNCVGGIIGAEDVTVSPNNDSKKDIRLELAKNVCDSGWEWYLKIELPSTDQSRKPIPCRNHRNCKIEGVTEDQVLRVSLGIFAGFKLDKMFTFTYPPTSPPAKISD